MEYLVPATLDTAVPDGAIVDLYAWEEALNAVRGCFGLPQLGLAGTIYQ
jgi:hypothetical protein